MVISLYPGLLWKSYMTLYGKETSQYADPST